MYPRLAFVALQVLGLCTFPLAARADFTRADAESAVQKTISDRQATLRTERAGELEKKAIELGERTLLWKERVFGEAPAAGRSLWISMHGGGNGPAAMNDQQWENQIRLYSPEEGIYIAPRAPTNTWNLWHEAHIDPMFDRLIEDYVALRGVNPNRVYLLGYSAGGDGVWQLAPRMADRWAAVAMMAGHPNDASLLPLRNLPIALFVGGNDAAYKRNEIVAAKGAELDRLAAADPGAYEHTLHVYPGLPHWMNRKDAEAIPWLATHTRQPWPKKIIWVQSSVTHERFYWLGVPAAEAKKDRSMTAVAEGQRIALTGDVPSGTTVFLTDAFIDLDKPVTMSVNGKEVFSGKAARTQESIDASLTPRVDAGLAATARVVVP